MGGSTEGSTEGSMESLIEGSKGRSDRSFERLMEGSTEGSMEGMQTCTGMGGNVCDGVDCANGIVDAVLQHPASYHISQDPKTKIPQGVLVHRVLWQDARPHA